ncbi:MAG: hypothetical protein UT05_C0002G0006 [Parcubacteria group bacterium GW2011_GWF2_38_76]|nr:MAG: hypothetical protein UT05_C0002G0006 [Parcubacteria group bacterium GW2011_GWF2_38_76]HBM45838.1 hypothetical protein [Patescibacteria group bacterium]
MLDFLFFLTIWVCFFFSGRIYQKNGYPSGWVVFLTLFASILIVSCGTSKNNNVVVAGSNNQPTPSVSVTEEIKVTSYIINPRKNLKEAIKAGKYNKVNKNITSKNFPTNPSDSGTKEIFLLNYNEFNKDENCDYEQIRASMKKRGFRPASLLELLSLGEKYPELQKKFYILTFCKSRLGQSFVGLYSNDDNEKYTLERTLELAHIALFTSIATKNRFAVVKK